MPSSFRSFASRFTRAIRRLGVRNDNQRFDPILAELFSCFSPNSAGSLEAREHLTIEAIHQTIPCLSELASSLNSQRAPILDINELAKDPDSRSAAINLKKILDEEGSDKSNHHSYHWLYGKILNQRNDIRRILEIGLGTNHEDVVSNMSSNGKPGASLRAFKKFCPNAEIIGADIDHRILFSEPRITTYQVDQTDDASLANLASQVPEEFDLVIDDGLHSPHANLKTLAMVLPLIKVRGWIVIEDIAPSALSIWQLVYTILPANDYHSTIYKDGEALIFAIQRLA